MYPYTLEAMIGTSTGEGESTGDLRAEGKIGEGRPGSAAIRVAAKSRWRGVAAACIVAAGFLFVAAILSVSVANANPAGRDFIEYWAAEQLLVHDGNPYDAVGMLRTERAEGFDLWRPEFWYSPPMALVLALPLGFVSAKTGLFLWLLVHFACLSASIWIIWLLNGRVNTLLPLFGFLFAPVHVCLQAGQISIFFLLGVVLFLYFHESRPFLAGVSLLPCALKPHLFLPFAVVLLLWMVCRKTYWILAGSLAAVAAGCAVTLCFDRHAWSQYSHLMRTDGMLNEFVATLSVSLRFLVDRNAVWLQFVPVAAACGWAGWYFWTRRERWNWMDQGLLLLLVSGVCAPYGWLFDESVLLPAVLTGVFRARESGRSLVPIALIAGAALVELNTSVSIMSRAYLWTTPAWLAWYLYATRKKEAPSPAPALQGLN